VLPEEAKKPRFERILKAIRPNIIGLEEIYNHSVSDVSERMEEILPSPVGQSWQAANIWDNFIVTRYEILGSFFCGPYNNGAFYLDLNPDFNTKALVLVAHPPCCDNDQWRQPEIDAMMEFVREAKQPGGKLTIPEATPIIIMGDMNLVGDTQQLVTFLTGDIVNENSFGNDFTPDWDGSNFLDSAPIVTGLPMAFTQGNNYFVGAFAKGRLDFMIYSGSVLTRQNGFVLYTHSLHEDILSKYNLLADDSEGASDHFPVVTDFTINDFNPTKIKKLDHADNFELFTNYPNPFNPTTTIRYSLPSSEHVRIVIFDLAGNEVQLLLNENKTAGTHQLIWDAKELSSGIYLIQISAGNFTSTQKAILIK